MKLVELRGGPAQMNPPRRMYLQGRSLLWRGVTKYQHNGRLTEDEQAEVWTVDGMPEDSAAADLWFAELAEMCVRPSIFDALAKSKGKPVRVVVAGVGAFIARPLDEVPS